MSIIVTDSDPLAETARCLAVAQCQDQATGHDPHHLERVARTAVAIARKEGAPDLQVVQCAAWLHDIADHKYIADPDIPQILQQARTALVQAGMSMERARLVEQIIQGVSFRGAGVATPMESLEGACVQDADRLDALGAIGIARCFAYGGAKGRPLYDSAHDPILHKDFAAYRSSQGASLHHFREKLLLLKDRMQTHNGRKLAEQRHRYLLEFESRFLSEWNGSDLFETP